MEEILKRIVGWGQADERVRAMLLTGSHARPDSADAFSDLDIALFGEMETLAEDDGWMQAIAPVWVCLPLATDEGHPTRLVIFEGNRKVDFSLLPLQGLRDLIDARPLPELYDRGYRVLLDKDGLAAELPPPRGRHHQREIPAAEAFRATVEEFWFEVWHVGKYLARGELWHAKFRDWTTEELLLRMIEWHANARHGGELDTHHLGIGMREWAEPAVWARLHGVFAPFNAEESWAALSATSELFSELARDLAGRLGYPYPHPLEGQILQIIAEWRSLPDPG